MPAVTLKRRIGKLEQVMRPQGVTELRAEFLEITEDGRLRRTADGEVFEVSAEGGPIRDSEEGEGSRWCIKLVGGPNDPRDRAHQRRIEQTKLAAMSR